MNSNPDGGLKIKKKTVKITGFTFGLNFNDFVAVAILLHHPTFVVIRSAIGSTDRFIIGRTISWAFALSPVAMRSVGASLKMQKI